MIAIIGAGNAGKALGRAFLRAGKKIYFGVSNIPKHRSVIKEIDKNIPIGTVQEAILASDTVVLAVPYAAALQIAASIPGWDNRILIDMTSACLPDFSGLMVDSKITSAAEEIAKLAHGARVVKAFNTIGVESIENPRLVDGKVFMPVCSDNDEARRQVMGLGSLIGLGPVDCGGLRSARFIEPLVIIWLQLSFKLGHGRNFEFGLLKKQEMENSH